MFNNLRAELVKRNLDVRKLATTMPISEVSLYNKMNGTTEFKLNEMELIKQVLRTEAPFEYLFKR